MRHACKTGLMLLAFLLMIPVLIAADANDLETGVVTGDVVNVRDEASLTGAAVGQVAKDDEVEVVATEGDWTEIVFEGERAFVHTDFVAVQSSVQAPDDSPGEIGIEVNGEPLQLDDITPYEEEVDGGTRVLVPFRAISETMGIDVSWEQESRFVRATQGDIHLRFEMEERRTYINGERKELDGEPKLITEQLNGESVTRTMIPLRFFAETFGAEVFWDSGDRTVMINQLDMEEETEKVDEEETGNTDPGEQEDLHEDDVASASLTGEVDVATELNMREGPGTGYSVITRLADGQIVEVKGFEDHWAKVRTAADEEGYVHSGFLHISETDEETEKVDEEETGKPDPGEQEDLPEEEVASARLTGEVDVATELNMREGPGTGYSVIARLADGQIVEVEGFEDHWAKVRTAADEAGYVHSGFLHISEYEAPFFQLGAPEVTEEPHRTTMRFPKRGSFDQSINLIETGAGVALANGNISLETTSFSGAGFGSANVRDGFVDLFVDSSYHYVVRDHRNELVLDLLPKGLEGKRIFLDAGHGGRDTGAVSNGLVEKEVALDVSLRAQELLEEAGAEVIMSRTTDVFLELDERVTLANRAEADLFVSVHANAMGLGNTAANGSETFWHDAYSPIGSERIAKLMQEEMVAKLGTHDRGVFGHRAFRVIRHTEMPSTLIELGFLTNADDAAILRSSEGIENSAQSILDAVKRYYE